VRIQRVALKHHRHVAIVRGHVVHELIVDAQLAAADRLQPRDHTQRCALAASGWAHEYHELAVPHLEVDTMDGYDILATLLIYFPHALQRYARHTHRLSR